MKLVLTADNRIGVDQDGKFVDVSSVFDDIRYRTAKDRMPRVLAVFHDRLGKVQEAAASGEPTDMPALQAPVPRPPKLIAAFGNYREFQDRPLREQDMFLESPESVNGPGGTVILPPHPATKFHHEAELALIVGKRAKDLKADNSALEYLAGYSCGLDISGRGLGRRGPSRMGKSFDTFTPIGPAIVTIDEVDDPQNLDVRLSVNGDLRQEYNTSDMEYTVVEILAFISGYMTLVPGDVIICGTNHQGLSSVQDGDKIEMSIKGVGDLSVSVQDPSKREWPREIDEEMAARARGVTAS